MKKLNYKWRNKRRRRKKVKKLPEATVVLNILYILFLVAFVILYTKYIDLAWGTTIGSKLNVICMWIMVVFSVIPYILLKKIRGVILLLLSFFVILTIIPEARMAVTIFVVPIILLMIIAIILAILIGMIVKAKDSMEENGQSIIAVIIGFGMLILIIGMIAAVIWAIILFKNASFFGYN